jgi:hypothetical protein
MGRNKESAPFFSCDAFFVLQKDSRKNSSDQRIAAFPPGAETALQRTNALDALFSEEQRHTGARGFVGSSTVENDLAVARQRIAFLLEILGVHAEGAGNGFGIGFEIHGMAQVHDNEFFARVDFQF